MGIGWSKKDSLQNNRLTKKHGAAGKFSPKVTKQIFEFDEYQCAYCRSFQIQSVPHHCYFKSQMGLGSFENGATVCTTCHDWAHCLSDGVNGEDRTGGRGWFERYSDRKSKRLEETS